MLGVYTDDLLWRNLLHEDQRRALGYPATDATSRDPVAFERAERCVCGFRRDGYQQAAGRLRIEQQILMLGRNASVKSRAICKEGAIVLEAAGEVTFAGRFDGAREILKRGVIDLQRNRRELVGWIAKGHFTRAAQQAEACYIGHGMNRARRGGAL